MEQRDLLQKMVAHDQISLKVRGNDFLIRGLSLRRFGCGDDDRHHGYLRDGIVVDRSIFVAQPSRCLPL